MTINFCIRCARNEIAARKPVTGQPQPECCDPNSGQPDGAYCQPDWAESAEVAAIAIDFLRWGMRGKKGRYKRPSATRIAVIAARLGLAPEPTPARIQQVLDRCDLTVESANKLTDSELSRHGFGPRGIEHIRTVSRTTLADLIARLDAGIVPAADGLAITDDGLVAFGEIKRLYNIIPLLNLNESQRGYAAPLQPKGRESL